MLVTQDRFFLYVLAFTSISNPQSVLQFYYHHTCLKVSIWVNPFIGHILYMDIMHLQHQEVLWLTSRSKG